VNIGALIKPGISNMNKLSYNIPHQRTANNNYWLGGGMANNLANANPRWCANVLNAGARFHLKTACLAIKVKVTRIIKIFSK